MSAPAKPGFRASEIEGQSTELIQCDLDGDQLKDLVLVGRGQLLVFFQQAAGGYTREPQLRWALGDKPVVLWPARLGRAAESLLLLTCDGVTELAFANRTDPPAVRPMIRQETVVPQTLDEPGAIHFPITVDTPTGWPLVLVPTDAGLQVWRHRAEYELAQTLEHTAMTHLLPSLRNPGYTQLTRLSLAVGDLNGDHASDLVFRTARDDGLQTYAVFLQTAAGQFGAKPALVYEDKSDWHSWHCWADINQDGRVDLIKSKWLEDPWFFPGVSSGKVWVGLYLADESGRLPPQPQQVFRKNDWLASVPVVDVDGDGYMDLVLGATPFDTRETFRKMLTTRQIELILRFHFYRRTGGYPPDPDCQATVLIKIDRPGLHPSWPLQRYFERFVCLFGDFDGDGRKDLAVRDRSDQVSVACFVSRDKGFSREAGFRFKCPEPIESMTVDDLNGDGVSDLILKLRTRDAFRIFLSERR